MKALIKNIEDIITPSVEALGYELVRVMLAGGQKPVLQIMAERKDGADMTVDDCASVSQTVSALLDVEDPLEGAYTLEVSSPGLDRPLTRPKDFANHAGREAKIETIQPVSGRKRFQGPLKGLEGEDVVLEQGGEDVRIPFCTIQKAKLVLTEERLREALRAQEKRNKD